MKLGIILQSCHPEIVWNAFRFGNFSRSMGDEVRLFLIGQGVFITTGAHDGSLDAGKFKVSEQLNKFAEKRGTIYACGSCLENHGLTPAEMYTVATLGNLYEIVKESDKVVTF